MDKILASHLSSFNFNFFGNVGDSWFMFDGFQCTILTNNDVLLSCQDMTYIMS